MTEIQFTTSSAGFGQKFNLKAFSTKRNVFLALLSLYTKLVPILSTME